MSPAFFRATVLEVSAADAVVASASVTAPATASEPSAERAVVKTDYPMIVGDFESVNKIKQLHLSEQERRQLFGENAAQAVNL